MNDILHIVPIFGWCQSSVNGLNSCWWVRMRNEVCDRSAGPPQASALTEFLRVHILDVSGSHSGPFLAMNQGRGLSHALIREAGSSDTSAGGNQDINMPAGKSKGYIPVPLRNQLGLSRAKISTSSPHCLDSQESRSREAK
jgi:hypothetical protein